MGRCFVYLMKRARNRSSQIDQNRPHCNEVLGRTWKCKHSACQQVWNEVRSEDVSGTMFLTDMSFLRPFCLHVLNLLRLVSRVFSTLLTHAVVVICSCYWEIEDWLLEVAGWIWMTYKYIQRKLEYSCQNRKHCSLLACSHTLKWLWFYPHNRWWLRFVQICWRRSMTNTMFNNKFIYWHYRPTHSSYWLWSLTMTWIF